MQGISGNGKSNIFRWRNIQETEVIEWYKRIKIATDFYTASAEAACSILENLSSVYSITHVVMKNDSSIAKIANCSNAAELYRDEDFVVYQYVEQSIEHIETGLMEFRNNNQVAWSQASGGIVRTNGAKGEILTMEIIPAIMKHKKKEKGDE